MTMSTTQPTSGVAAGRAALLREASDQLAKHLSLLSLSMHMVSWPYRELGPNLARSSARLRADLERMSSAARLLSDAEEPVDPKVLELDRLAERLQKGIIDPLQELGQSNRSTGRVLFDKVSENVSSLLRDCEARLAVATKGIDKSSTKKIAGKGPPRRVRVSAKAQ
jgi:hypothetical protein